MNDPTPQLDRVDELLWLMLDEEITEPQLAELEAILAADPAARQRSVEASQLHAELFDCFREEKPTSAIAPGLPMPLPGMGMTTK